MASPQSLLTPSFRHRALVQALVLVLSFPSVFIHAQNTTAECSEDYDWVIQLFTNHTCLEGIPFTATQLRKGVARALKLLGDIGEKPVWWWSAHGSCGPNR